MREWEQVVMVALGLTAACVLVSMGATELAGVVAGGALGYMSKSAPKAAATLLVLCLGCSLVSGCTAAQQQQATTVGRDVLAWTCAPAKKICEMFATSTDFGVSACAAIETACDIGGAILNSAPAPVEAEQPHDLSTDPGVPVSCVEPLRHHTPLVCQVLDRRPLRDHARVRT